jgi:formylglycine-generating enzyme required for sulfatase activity
VTHHAELLPTGSTPRGFVRVPRQVDDVPYAFWIMEREVTAAEYLEYLNEPATRAAIEAGEQPPRQPRARAGEPLVARGDDGQFVLDADWRADWPVVAISQPDAQASAAYRNARRKDAHDDHVLVLPILHEWTVAAVAGEMRMYVFGRRFRPKWVSSCYATPTPGPTPVLSFPRDESPTGALDMCGSAMEWSVDRYDGGREFVRLLGGAWGRADPEMFKVQGGIGLHPDSTSGETGMRLVLRPRNAR